jgi:hypothetical protein
MKLILDGRTSTIVENGCLYYVNGDLQAWPPGKEIHYLAVALVVTPDEQALITKYEWDKMPLCKGGLRGLNSTVNFDVEDLITEEYIFNELNMGVHKFGFDDSINFAFVESQIEKNARDLKHRLCEATGIQKDTLALTVPEASLFLLLLAANVDTSTDKFGLNGGELTEQEEAFILGLCNKWGLYGGFSSQSGIEAAITKYQFLKSSSLNREDFIVQCAELLIPMPALRDITYYLCLDILFLNGKIVEDSVEEDLISNLERILKMNPAVADFVYGLEIFKTVIAD